MTTAPQRDTAAIAAPTPRSTAAMPRLRLSPRGVSIDHPDPETGERLMAEALGIADRDAMHGILSQLVKASVSGRKPDKTSLAFMLAMVESIRPRDAIEAMLVTQMVSIHVLAMRCAYRLASAKDITQQDSATRALGRLSRTFPAQIEALSRYRNKGETGITVQNLSVQDGSNAIVGNVTQIERVIVHPGAADAAADAQAAAAHQAGEREPLPVHATPAARP